MNIFFRSVKFIFWAGIRPGILYQAVPSEARGSVVKNLRPNEGPKNEFYTKKFKMFIVYANAVGNDTSLHSIQHLKLIEKSENPGKSRKNPEKIREKIRIFQKLSEMV